MTVDFACCCLSGVGLTTLSSSSTSPSSISISSFLATASLVAFSSFSARFSSSRFASPLSLVAFTSFFSSAIASLFPAASARLDLARFRQLGARFRPQPHSQTSLHHVIYRCVVRHPSTAKINY
ncbi:hypothetical protein THRCLA_21707 [Thraustotheca clavata]|uniref:Uncharacterized protein n=1 Tax=Thraustotheca clavata TaxID=74557 RepID=A0A1V9ZQN8_9STRA|nr:hypothetical protein THRCLA_21707 [Thraustotheca clavata]